MSRREQIIAIALPFLFCGVLLAFLGQYAERQRTVVQHPLLMQVPSPEHSFNIWSEKAQHGRIIVIIDRHLNAEDVVRGSEFHVDEFPDRAALERCCSAIRTDILNMAPSSPSCTVEELNSAVIQRLVLYPLFLRSGLTDTDGKITRLAGHMGYPRGVDMHIQPVYNEMVPLLNRLIIERMLPGACPKPTEYPVSDKNYLHQAVRSGIARKAYHLLSDNAWDEVSGALMQYGDKVIRTSDSSFRIAIAEGVPVRIMRLRDMPQLTEPAVVVVNTDSLEEGELSMLPDLIAVKLKADIVTVSGTGAAQVLRSLEGIYASR